MQDIDSVYIAFQPDLAVPGAVDIIRSFTQFAVKSGVSKLVLLSGRGEKEAQQCEQVVIHAGVDWTVLRCSWFNQNFSEHSLLEPVLAGYVALPSGRVKEPFVDAGDIADVAVAALTERGHVGQIYELTGPLLLSFEEAVEEISKATGRPIQSEHLTMNEYVASLLEYGVPTEYIGLLRYLFTEVLDGRNASLANGVQRALGREPLDFSGFTGQTAASGVWDVI